MKAYKLIAFGVFALLPPLSASISAAQAPPSADTVDAGVAVTTVSNAFTPNPLVLVESTGKPLASTGSWGLLRRFPGPSPAGCQKDRTVCVKVLYSSREDQVVCSWIVGFVPQPEGRGKPAVLKPVVLAEDENASRYTLERVQRGDERLRVVSQSGVIPHFPIGGVVVVEVIVDQTGHVQRATALSGPAMLQPMSIDSAKQLEFKALVVGEHRTSFSTEVSFSYETAMH